MKKPFVNSYWNPRPTEDMMFTTAYSAESNWNESYWKNERFNQLLNQARSELDTAKRREMYFEMQRLCHDQGGSIVLFFRNIVEAAKDRIEYENVAGNFEIDGCRAPERWWLAGGIHPGETKITYGLLFPPGYQYTVQGR